MSTATSPSCAVRSHPTRMMYVRRGATYSIQHGQAAKDVLQNASQTPSSEDLLPPQNTTTCKNAHLVRKRKAHSLATFCELARYGLEAVLAPDEVAGSGIPTGVLHAAPSGSPSQRNVDRVCEGDSSDREWYQARC